MHGEYYMGGQFCVRGNNINELIISMLENYSLIYNYKKLNDRNKIDLTN